MLNSDSSLGDDLDQKTLADLIQKHRLEPEWMQASTQLD
jgi:hypothetical protein